MENNKIIEIKDLYLNFDKLEVLKGISLDVYSKDVIAIIGSSGSGKSTLLRCLNLLEKPDSGIIKYKGINILDKKTNIDDVRKSIGMVFQSFNLFDNMNVLENCTIAQIKVLKRNKEEAIEIAKKYLIQVGMGDFIYSDSRSLSGGQKQRVAIARSLCMNPDVILFDEPTSALDPEMVSEVLNVIKDVANSGITMLIVTHEMGFAREVSNKILFLNDGYVEVFKDTNEFFENPGSPRACEFLRKVL